MPSLTVAVCTYNRAERLPKLIESLRALAAPIPFEILIINNNSTDDTLEVLKRLDVPHPVGLRVVTETQQGIPYARNRAVKECLDRNYMLFMDDDELPGSDFVSAAFQALEDLNADCVGGRVIIRFPASTGRPKWLTDSLLGFLAETDHGIEPFQITDTSTPIWTANVGYRMSIFREHPEIRFDTRYNRAGVGVGGGEDVIMFRTLLDRQFKLWYVPEMAVEHFVEDWKMRRVYFLKLHFDGGKRHGQHEVGQYPRTIFGVPLFLMTKTIRDFFAGLGAYLRSDPEALRTVMTASHTAGTVWGLLLRWNQDRRLGRLGRLIN